MLNTYTPAKQKGGHSRMLLAGIQVLNYVWMPD